MNFKVYTTTFVLISILLLLVQLIAGSLYAFGAISEGLKEQGFGHAVPVPLLGAAANIGTFVSIYNGWFVDRVGPGISLAVGGGLLGLGYSALSAIVQLEATNAREYAAVLAFFVVGNGAVLSFLSAYTSAAAYVPLPQWVGGASGTVLGAYAGAAALCAFMFKSVLNSKLVDFFELLSLSSHAISGAGALAVLYLSVKNSDYVAAATADASGRGLEALGGQQTQALIVTAEASEALMQAVAYVPAKSKTSTDSDFSVCTTIKNHARMMSRPAFVVLWTIVFLGLGSALMFVNTISDVAAAVTEGHVAASTLTRDCVIAFALCNVGARIVGGFGSDGIDKHGFSRLWVLLLGALVGVAAHSMIAFTPRASSDHLSTWLVSSSCLVGISEGLLFLWPVAGRDWFGAKKTGIFFTLLNSAVGVGSAVYTAAASGVIHQHSTTVESASGILVSHCEGSVCFQQSYIAAAASNLLAILLGVWVIKVISNRKPGTAVRDMEWRCHYCSGRQSSE